MTLNPTEVLERKEKMDTPIKKNPTSDEDLSHEFGDMSLLTKDVQQKVETQQEICQYFAESEKEDSDVDEDKEEAATESAYKREIERVLEETMWTEKDPNDPKKDTKKDPKYKPAALTRKLFKTVFSEEELKSKTMKELDKGRRSNIRDAIFKKFSVPEEARYYYWIGIQQSVSKMIPHEKASKSGRSEPK